MQLLEASLWGLRSARICLTRPGEPLSVTLFPMVHIGERAFYDAVYPDASQHDVILAEGVDSPIARHITRSYRWISGSKISNLVVQPRLPRTGGAEVIASDLSGAEFDAAWRQVPFWMRALLFVAAPFVGFRRRGQTRQHIPQGLSLEDAASQKELVEWSPEAGLLDHVILDSRDRRLLMHLDQQLDAGGSGSIAVVYGALHMRAVFRHLVHTRGFTSIETEWMTVFAT